MELFEDSVSRFYRNKELQDNINNLLSNCKTKEERKEVATSLRSLAQLDRISELLISNYPAHVLVS